MMDANNQDSPTIDREISFEQTIFWSAIVGIVGGLVATAYYLLLEASQHWTWKSFPLWLERAVGHEIPHRPIFWRTPDRGYDRDRCESGCGDVARHRASQAVGNLHNPPLWLSGWLYFPVIFRWCECRLGDFDRVSLDSSHAGDAVYISFDFQ